MDSMSVTVGRRRCSHTSLAMTGDVNSILIPVKPVVLRGGVNCMGLLRLLGLEYSNFTCEGPPVVQKNNKIGMAGGREGKVGREGGREREGNTLRVVNRLIYMH